MTTGMVRLVAAGLLLVFAVEALAVLVAPDRRAVLWLSGAVVAVVFLAARRFMAGMQTPEPDVEPDGPTESLQRWKSRTEAMLRWADSTRADWDRHLRPRLAREFVMATGQKPGKDPAALQATGRMVFGDDLWQWVDPSNVAQSGRHEPGPGRAALDEILRRMERI